MICRTFDATLHKQNERLPPGAEYKSNNLSNSLENPKHILTHNHVYSEGLGVSAPGVPLY